MGNLLITEEDMYYTCHNCQKKCEFNGHRREVRHGIDWEYVCSDKCLKEWKLFHDHNANCCTPGKSLYRPLLPEK